MSCYIILIFVGASTKEIGHLDPRHLDPRNLDPRYQDARHLDPLYCTVYKTVETGVEMSNFGNKVGHLECNTGGRDVGGRDSQPPV